MLHQENTFPVPLDLLPPGPQLPHHRADALLVDDTYALGRECEGDKAPLVLHPEPLALEVQVEPPAGPVIGVAHVVAEHGPPAGHLTVFTHALPAPKCSAAAHRQRREVKAAGRARKALPPPVYAPRSPPFRGRGFRGALPHPPVGLGDTDSSGIHGPSND